MHVIRSLEIQRPESVLTEDVLVSFAGKPNRPFATPLKNADHVFCVANGYGMEIPIDAKVHLISGPAHILQLPQL
ncbi:hypothetical protein TNCV_2597661 [Trichonephila clavipes]|nr:hypothetical protein TNCV_2597661 [Trichonephila clavipes]